MRHVERAHYVDPVGWLTIAATYWPEGTDLGTLHLRVCASCAAALTPAPPTPEPAPPRRAA